ncbi:MAG: hypothetical protein ACPL4I_10995 [Bacteroidota bacterium]
MDAVVISLDISPVAVALALLGFFVGLSISSVKAYPASSVLAFILGVNSGRYVLGGPYDATVLPSFLGAAFFAGFTAGNYLEYRNRSIEAMLISLHSHLMSLSSNCGEKKEEQSQ